MLELINLERTRAGLQPVVMGDNAAAQLHAEAALEGCFSSHWGLDGLKPYMRYSIAGGHQSSGENVHGSDYCITDADNYRPITNIEEEVREAMAGWMDSPGHRRNILRPKHRRVNIGLAWDRYNFKAVQQFEGDYVEYEGVPTLENGMLTMSGKMKNGVQFQDERDLLVRIDYDPSPRQLTLGQVSRTYCYRTGLHVANLRPPASGDRIYFRDEITRRVDGSACPDPYEVSADAPAARSHEEARALWQGAYDASQRQVQDETLVLAMLTASEWRIDGSTFSVKADIGRLLEARGNGVYTVALWAPLNGEDTVVSTYSLFVDDLPGPVGTAAVVSEFPVSDVPPAQRHIEVKRRMLDLINEERAAAGLTPLVLGENAAAQLHAEASLTGCFSSHWDLNGLKPYMRYSLAGGYQVNSSYVVGSDYCIVATDGYRAKDSVVNWMSENALDWKHRKVNIGLAWDEYNTVVVLQYEGDYVEYDRLPAIEDGVLAMSGTVGNGVVFEEDRDLGVQLFYDPPPRPLTGGQIARTYCADSGVQVASVRRPPPSGSRYTSDDFEKSYRPCPDPYTVQADMPAPTSRTEARELWETARAESGAREELTVTLPWVTAQDWSANGEAFEVRADVREVVDVHGPGVYRVVLWAPVDGERAVISEYALFHEIEPPAFPPTQTPPPVSSLTEVERALMARGIMNRMGRNMLDLPSLDFTISSLSDQMKWHVSYTGMLQGDDARRALGTFTNRKSGEEFDFDSTYRSTCMRKLVPETGPWVYVEHNGWDNVSNPDVFTPFAPLAFARIDPIPDWTVLDITDEVVVLGHSPFEDGDFDNLSFVLYASKAPVLVTRFDLVYDGEAVLSTTEFSGYGENDVGDRVHSSQQDCEGRNQ